MNSSESVDEYSQFDYFNKYGRITFEFQSDAQNFAGQLIWKEIPFKVGYKMDGSTVIHDMRNWEDDGK
jgi:hypothetical protein